MMKLRYLFVMLAFCGFIGCADDNEDLKPSPGLEWFYELPQGNHEYDKKIVEWRDKYGVYVLYNYDVNDVYWSGTSWIGWNGQWGYGTNGTLDVTLPDTNYVGQMVDLLDEIFFSSRENQAEMVTEYVPKRIFICSTANTLDGWTDNTTGEDFIDTTSNQFYTGYGSLIVAGANRDFWEDLSEEKRQDSIDDLTWAMNLWYLETLLGDNAIEYPLEEFAAVSADYYGVTTDGRYGVYGSTLTTKLLGEQRFELGFLHVDIPRKETLEDQIAFDWECYWNMVMNVPMDSLTDPEPYAYWNPETPPDRYNFAGIEGGMNAYNFMYDNRYGEPVLSNYKGVLSKKRDANGLCMQKYMIIVNWLQDEVGFNLDMIRYPNGRPDGAE